METYHNTCHYANSTSTKSINQLRKFSQPSHKKNRNQELLSTSKEIVSESGQLIKVKQMTCYSQSHLNDQSKFQLNTYKITKNLSQHLQNSLQVILRMLDQLNRSIGDKVSKTHKTFVREIGYFDFQQKSAFILQNLNDLNSAFSINNLLTDLQISQRKSKFSTANSHNHFHHEDRKASSTSYYSKQQAEQYKRFEGFI